MIVGFIEMLGILEGIPNYFLLYCVCQRSVNHTAGVMSRCRCIDVHIFGFVQATLPGAGVI